MPDAFHCIIILDYDESPLVQFEIGGRRYLLQNHDFGSRFHPSRFQDLIRDD